VLAGIFRTGTLEKDRDQGDLSPLSMAPFRSSHGDISKYVVVIQKGSEAKEKFVWLKTMYVFFSQIKAVS